MKTLLLLILLSLQAIPSLAQQTVVRGNVLDNNGQPVRSVAVSLLEPSDSTLAFFGVSNAEGIFEVRGVRQGDYLLQAAAPGMSSFYRTISAPLSATLPAIILQRAEEQGDLAEVEVRAERIPILIKKDTIEYNAGSFRTKPDAVAEDLLRTMPGMEVDKDGNIKAQGKDVRNVLVDGKEFFGTDPKVATKNLPADAIDKVQVFDGLSSMAQFTGMDDGTRDRTVNFVLKDGKRKGYFGDIEGGIGTAERFKAAAHLYSFRKKSQFAALGMANNINQFGLSLGDYLNFNGGIRALTEGGGAGNVQFNGNSAVNFGQQLTGLITSGTGGINYTLEPKDGRRFNISYLANGATKKLDQTASSENLTDSAIFTRNDDSRERNTDWGHHFYYNWRYDLDTMQQLKLSGTTGYSLADADRKLSSSSAIREVLLNRLDSRVADNATGYDATASLSYLHRFVGSWPVVRTSLNAGINNSRALSMWENNSYQPASPASIYDGQYQQNELRRNNWNATFAASRRLSTTHWLDPELIAGSDYDALRRRQGPSFDQEVKIDSLSPAYERSYRFVRPGVSLRHSVSKLQYSLALRAEKGWLQRGYMNATDSGTSRSYALPAASLRYAPKNSTSYTLYYGSSVAAPTARQLLPATDYTNPLLRQRGNPALLPEYRHNFNARWMRYDQYSFSSANAGIDGQYTNNKIAYSRIIRQDLSQDISYVNVADDYNLTGHAEYSTPLRPLGVSVSAGVTENYQYSQSLVNGVMNINTTWTHSGRLRIGNRKKDKWDAEVSLAGDLTDSRFSVQQTLNARFVHYNASGRLSWKPSTRFYFSLTGDVDHYTSRSFHGAITVPLLNASASLYCLKGNRGVVTVDGYDLLNRNQAVQRISQLNYLLEQRSNVLQRYVMVSLKYRLTATGSSSPGGIRIGN